MSEILKEKKKKKKKEKEGFVCNCSWHEEEEETAAAVTSHRCQQPAPSRAAVGPGAQAPERRCATGPCAGHALLFGLAAAQSLARVANAAPRSAAAVGSDLNGRRQLGRRSARKPWAGSSMPCILFISAVLFQVTGG